jgi:hypothetical protein
MRRSFPSGRALRAKHKGLQPRKRFAQKGTGSAQMRMTGEGLRFGKSNQGGGRRTVHYEFPCSIGGTPQNFARTDRRRRVSEVESQVVFRTSGEQAAG